MRATIWDRFRIDPEEYEQLQAFHKSATNYGPFLTYLADRGWGVPAHSLAARSYNVALADTNYDFGLAEGRVAEYYESITPNLVEDVVKQPALSHLTRALEDAGRAHADARYALAVPIWLIAIDATVNALCRRASRQKAKAFTAIGEDKYRRFFESLFEGGGHRLRGLLGRTLSRMGQRDTFADALAPTVNRNAALHGSRCYFERDDSLRVLTVLFALIDEGVHDEASARKAAGRFN